MEIVNGMNFFNCPKTYIKLDGTESLSLLRGIRADKVFCPTFKKDDKDFIKQIEEVILGIAGIKYGDLIFY